METIKKTALTTDEASVFLCISKNYLYKLISQKRIPFYKPLGGRVYFKPTELEAFLFRNRQSADYEAKSV